MHALTCLLLLLIAGLDTAQSEPPSPVNWSLSLKPAAGTRRPGKAFTAVIGATIEDGWHVYAAEEVQGGPRPLRVELPGSQPFTAAGPLEAPEPERDFDSAFSLVTAYYTRQVAVRLPVSVVPRTPPGKRVLTVDVAFQACDGRLCLPARVVRLEAPVTISK